MLSRDTTEIKTTKTLLLFGFANLAMAPLELFNSNLWLFCSVAMNAYLLHSLHTLGKSRRPGLNFFSSASNLVSSHVTGNSSALENGFRNVVNGGAAVLDEVVVKLAR